MKYKLISKITGEEHICDKVTIDGFDYYVSDEIIGEDELFVMGNELVYNSSLITDEWCKSSQPKPIATNNPNIDIPQAIEYSDILEDMAVTSTEENEIDDSIEYGHRLGFINGYNKSQETHPFSEEDVIEFADWLRDTKSSIAYEDNTCPRLYKKSTKELLQIWKEQQPKIVYYE